MQIQNKPKKIQMQMQTKIKNSDKNANVIKKEQKSWYLLKAKNKWKSEQFWI